MHIIFDGSSLQTPDLDINSSFKNHLDDVEFVFNEIVQEFTDIDSETIVFSPRSDNDSKEVVGNLIYASASKMSEYLEKYNDVDCIIHVGYHRQYEVPFNAKLNIDLVLGVGMPYTPEYVAKIDYFCYFSANQLMFLKILGVPAEKLIKLSFPALANASNVNPDQHFDVIYPGLPHNGIQHFINIVKDAKFKDMKIGIPQSTKTWVDRFRFDNYWQGEAVAQYLAATKECKNEITYYDDSTNVKILNAIQNSDIALYPYDSQQPTEFAPVYCLYANSIGKRVVVSSSDCLKEAFDKKSNCKVINSCKNYIEFVKQAFTPMLTDTGNYDSIEDVAFEIFELIKVKL